MRFLPVPEKAAKPRALALSPGAEMVTNRLRKNLRKLKTWRTREQVTCLRAYDADLPEYAAAIDVYEVVDGERPEDRGLWLHVQEYQAPKTIPEEETRRRLGELVQAAMQVFELPRDRVALKTRAPQSRQQRYQKQDSRAHWLWVMEDGLRVRLNLFDTRHRPVSRSPADQACLASLCQGRTGLESVRLHRRCDAAHGRGRRTADHHGGPVSDLSRLGRQQPRGERIQWSSASSYPS